MNPRRHHRAFLQARRELCEALRSYQQVQACGRGVKMSGGRVTGEPCLTLFVARKLPKSKLSRAQLIPRRIASGGKAHLTDVVELGRFRRQAPPQGYPFGVCLTDRIRNGTRSVYAETSQGLMALTCAHVIAGDDGDPMTPAAVYSYDWATQSWRPFGASDRAAHDPGAGDPLDFGYLDAALVKPLPEVEPQPVSPDPLKFFQPKTHDDIEALAGTPVNGFGIASGVCQGVIQTVLVNSVNGGRFAADLLVAALGPEGLTREGDSGMIWRDQAGRLIAQHALGQEAPPGQGSMLTMATLIHRIRDRLEIISFH